jgi:hypothetical protein
MLSYCCSNCWSNLQKKSVYFNLIVSDQVAAAGQSAQVEGEMSEGIALVVAQVLPSSVAEPAQEYAWIRQRRGIQGLSQNESASGFLPLHYFQSLFSPPSECAPQQGHLPVGADRQIRHCASTPITLHWLDRQTNALTSP